jgi:hypothetical protein
LTHQLCAEVLARGINGKTAAGCGNVARQLADRSGHEFAELNNMTEGNQNGSRADKQNERHASVLLEKLTTAHLTDKSPPSHWP